MIEDGKNKETGGKDFLNQSLCQDHDRSSSFAVSPTVVYLCSSIRYSGATQGSVPASEFAALGCTNLRTTRPVCSLAWGAQPHQPIAHRVATTFPTTVLRDGRLLSQNQGCHLPNNPSDSSTLTTQNPVPNIVYNFIQTCLLLSQISYLLALQMSVSSLSDRLLCLHSWPTHRRSTLL